MSFPPRRVVTATDAAGRAVVVSDEPAGNVISRRGGHRSTVIWASDAVPVELGADAVEVTERSLPNGTVFRLAEFEPGVATGAHRTDSIDYAVVLSGQIDLVLDDEVVTLGAGDVLVQRGTMHDWVNNGDVPCVMAFCLVGASG